MTGCIDFGDKARWWILSEVSALLAAKYQNFNLGTPFQEIGSALNDIQFNFKSRRVARHVEYWLAEK